MDSGNPDSSDSYAPSIVKISHLNCIDLSTPDVSHSVSLLKQWDVVSLHSRPHAQFPGLDAVFRIFLFQFKTEEEERRCSTLAFTSRYRVRDVAYVGA